MSRECTGAAKEKSCYKCGLTGMILRSYLINDYSAYAWIGHISRDCTDAAPQQGGYQGGSSYGTQCYKCGEAGHIARQCPRGGDSSAQGYGGGAQGYGGGAQGYGGSSRQQTCYSCGGHGAISRDFLDSSVC
jgi:cellular nucleic acid-binding protein